MVRVSKNYPPHPNKSFKRPLRLPVKRLPEGPATYGSLTEVRDAAVAGDYVCREWRVDNHLVGAMESGRCRDYDTFAIFANEEQVQAAVRSLENEPGELNLLTGPNWLIKTNRSEIEMITDRGMIGETFFRKADAGPQRGELELAAEFCEASEYLADQGKSFTIITGGDETEAEGTLEQLACVIYSLDVPDHVVSHIDSTRALDGQQFASWGNFDARWT